eukprot:6213194-Pleurochrysis_carterae.AAC.3
MPLALVTTTISSSRAGNVAFGASGTPSFAHTSSVTTLSSSTLTLAAVLFARRVDHSSPSLHPPCVPPRCGCATAYPPRSVVLTSGSTCARLESLLADYNACRQFTRALSAALARISVAMAKISSLSALVLR